MSEVSGMSELDSMSELDNMSEFKMTPELQFEIEQWYYREARLLDGRQYQQWLRLMSEQISYSMPSRINTQVNNRDRGKEEMISVDRELERAQDMTGCPLREENFAFLMMRVDRAYKMNSWAENPPARTRRIIGNVEVLEQASDQLKVISNFHLFYARPGTRDFLYSGQRRDTLQKVGEGYKVLSREIVMDYGAIDYPTMGLLF